MKVLSVCWMTFTGLNLTVGTSGHALACSDTSCAELNDRTNEFTADDNGRLLLDYVISTSSHNLALGLFRQSLLDAGYRSDVSRIIDPVSTLLAFDPPTDTQIPGLGTVDANLRSVTVEESFFKRNDDRSFDTVTVTTELIFKYDFDTRSFNIHIKTFSTKQTIRLPAGSISAAGG